jgi:Holliday junction resolvasome RuvABC ATP-dependent DNA helicase subunit
VKKWLSVLLLTRYTGIEHVVNIPQVNRFFTGQKKLLEEMQKKLCIAASDQKPSQNCFVIFGIGGVGKSEVCLRFATMNLQK